MTILEDIIAYKRDEVAAAKAARPLSGLDADARARGGTRGFAKRLGEDAEDGCGLIAEVKKASPSKGLIRADFDPPAIARAYAAGGASCLSVLTDRPSFQGSPEALVSAREACDLPVLRKDFMVDPYQIAEARAWGADCILVILACTDDALASELIAAAKDYGMDALVETHDEAEFERALALDTRLLGVNNRNLRTFKTSLEVVERLAPRAPAGRLVIAESGIAAPEDAARLARQGLRAFLIGETLMRAENIEAATRRLIETVRPSDSQV